MKRVIGLDLSLSGTGVAILQKDGLCKTRWFHTSRGMSATDLSRCQYILKETAKMLKPGDMVFIEEIVIVKHSFTSKKGFKQFNVSDSTVKLLEFVGMIKLMVRNATGTDAFVVHPKTLKKFATGKGDADKIDIREALRERYKLDFGTSDEADAWVCAKIGTILVGWGMVPEDRAEKEAVEATRNYASNKHRTATLKNF